MPAGRRRDLFSLEARLSMMLRPHSVKDAATKRISPSMIRRCQRASARDEMAAPMMLPEAVTMPMGTSAYRARRRLMFRSCQRFTHDFSILRRYTRAEAREDAMLLTIPLQ